MKPNDLPRPGTPTTRLLRQALLLLGVVVVTAAITYLAVVNRLTAERLDQATRALADAEARTAQLEDEVRQAHDRLRQAARPAEGNPTSTAGGRFAPPGRPGATSLNLLVPPAPAPSLPATETRVVATTVPVGLAAGSGFAGWMTYVARPGSRFTVQGKSNFRDWTVSTPAIGGVLAVDARFDLTQPSTFAGVAETNVPAWGHARIPVSSLKGGQVKSMDDEIRRALGAATFPQIEYRLQDLIFTGYATNADTYGAMQFNSKGEIALNGVTNQLEMPVIVQRERDGQVRVTGSAAFRLKDFKVQPKPPSAAGLAIEVADDFTVSFWWLLQRDKRVWDRP